MADNTAHNNRNFPSRLQKSSSQASGSGIGSGTPESPRSAVGCESPSSTTTDVLNQSNISPTSISPTSNQSTHHSTGQNQRPYFPRGRMSYSGGSHGHPAYNGGPNHHGITFNSGLHISHSSPSSKQLQDFMLLQWQNFESNYIGRRLRNSVNNAPLSSLRSQGRNNSPHHQPRGLHQVGHSVGGSRRFSDNSHHHHLNHSDSLGGDFPSGNSDDFSSNRRFRGPFQHNSHAPLFPSGDNSWQRGQLLSRNNSPDITSHQNPIQRNYGQAVVSTPQSAMATSSTAVTAATASACLNTNNANSPSFSAAAAPSKHPNTIAHHGSPHPNSSRKSPVSELSLELNSLSCTQVSSKAASGLSLASDGDSATVDCSPVGSFSHSTGLPGCAMHASVAKLHSAQTDDTDDFTSCPHDVSQVAELPSSISTHLGPTSASGAGADSISFYSGSFCSLDQGDILSTTDHYYTPDPSSSQTSSPPTILSPSDNTSSNFFQSDGGTVVSGSGASYPATEDLSLSPPDEIRPVFDHKAIFAASSR